MAAAYALALARTKYTVNIQYVFLIVRQRTGQRQSGWHRCPWRGGRHGRALRWGAAPRRLRRLASVRRTAFVTLVLYGVLQHLYLLDEFAALLCEARIVGSERLSFLAVLECDVLHLNISLDLAGLKLCNFLLKLNKVRILAFAKSPL